VTSERESSVLPTQSKIAHNLYLTQKKVYLACGTDIKRQRTSEQARPPLRKAKNEHLCDDLPLVLSRRDGWHKRLPRRDDRLFPFEAVQVDRVAPDRARLGSSAAGPQRRWLRRALRRRPRLQTGTRLHRSVPGEPPEYHRTEWRPNSQQIMSPKNGLSGSSSTSTAAFCSRTRNEK
jgi:hypothetical protein